ncbi:MAG TPA: hypothetical protein V6C81_31085 [Planktothrix sp.]|jgi:hypothetical protein
MSRNSSRSRSKRGIGCLELGLSSFLMVVCSALGLNMTLMVMGMSLNDSACRDAARAAAQQSTSALALKSAQAQLLVHATDGSFISQPSLSSTASPDFVYNDYSGNPPTNASPYVTVSTIVAIRLPFPMLFFSQRVATNSLNFKRTYTFPIIKETFYD